MIIDEMVELLLEIINMEDVSEIKIEDVEKALSEKNPFKNLETLLLNTYPKLSFEIFSTSRAEEVEGEFRPGPRLIKIIIPAPKNGSYVSYSSDIVSFLNHELVHFKQDNANWDSFKGYKQWGDSRFEYISYVLQQLESGAFAYQFAKKWYKFNVPFERVINYEMKKLFKEIKELWPSLKKNEKIWIKKQLSKFKRQYYNQVAKLQGR